jgi:hypothetical protein
VTDPYGRILGFLDRNFFLLDLIIRIKLDVEYKLKTPHYALNINNLVESGRLKDQRGS